jgi:hypothetical protein
VDKEVGRIFYIVKQRRKVKPERKRREREN